MDTLKPRATGSPGGVTSRETFMSVHESTDPPEGVDREVAEDPAEVLEVCPAS